MDIKKLFEIAGVDVTKGKAKELIEFANVGGNGDGDGSNRIELQQFLNKYPPFDLLLHLGNYNIGHETELVVHNSREFATALNTFGNKYLADDAPFTIYLVPTDDPDVRALVMHTDDEAEDDADSNEIGWFTSKLHMKRA